MKIRHAMTAFHGLDGAVWPSLLASRRFRSRKRRLLAVERVATEKMATPALDVPDKAVIGNTVADGMLDVLLHPDRAVLAKQVRPKVLPVSSLALAGRTRRANLPAESGASVLTGTGRAYSAGQVLASRSAAAVARSFEPLEPSTAPLAGSSADGDIGTTDEPNKHNW